MVRKGMFDNPLARDTSVEATRVQYAALRRMGVSGRMELMFKLSGDLREIVASGVRSRHREYSERQVQLAVLRLAWGDELFRRVYGDIAVPA